MTKSERWDDSAKGTNRVRTIAPMRVPPGKPLSMIVLSKHVVGAWTHYDGHRSSICLGTECVKCARLGAARWYGYLCVLAGKSGNKHLVEFTPRCMDAIEAWMETHGQLRGCELRLFRQGERKNSPLAAECCEPLFTPEKLPEPFDVREKLRVLWGLSTKPAGQRRLDSPCLEEPVLSDVDVVNQVLGKPDRRVSRNGQKH